MSSQSHHGTVLVSGAGVAGPLLAHWLDRAGFAVVLVERAAARREEGQNVDVRGAGREVLRRTGIEQAALAAHTTEEGTAFVDERGRPRAVLPAAQGESDGATAELEILRGKLSGLLLDLPAERTERVFGDHVTGLDDHGDGVTVTLASGDVREVDLVVVAEGVGSRTRDLVFGGDPVRPLGMYCVYVTIPRTATDDRTWRWYNALEGRSVHLRPDDTGTTRALLNFLSPTRGLADLDPAAQVTVLRRVFRDAGWETDRVLAALDGTPFHFEDLAQVHLDRWSSGRVVLLGDAAHCASPVSGMGTTLGLTGAYVLAGELATAHARGRSHTDAFAAYERRLRPLVTRAQDLPPGTPAVANPRTAWHRQALWTGVRVLTSRPARALGGLTGRFTNPPADAFTVPDYPDLPARAG
ncbi:FAD-dependent monooxygenase [Kineococcus endophyticus]|uniref:FAD-dependent monooxygenase n=1 Tax=Kineococcus endophyticus TaxID=1181883 RepID=A0ABV3P420_9ACTN